MKVATDPTVNCAICCCSVTKSRPALRDPVDCSTPGLPVLQHHQIITFYSLNMDHVICQSYLNKAGVGGNRKNNRVKLILFMLLCFTHTQPWACIYSYRNICDFRKRQQGLGPLVRPPTLRVSAVFTITNSPNVVTPIWALPAAAEMPK